MSDWTTKDNILRIIDFHRPLTLQGARNGGLHGSGWKIIHCIVCIVSRARNRHIIRHPFFFRHRPCGTGLREEFVLSLNSIYFLVLMENRPRAVAVVAEDIVLEIEVSHRIARTFGYGEPGVEVKEVIRRYVKVRVCIG